MVWIIQGIFFVCAVLLVLAWFFNTRIHHVLFRKFWFNYIVAVLGNLYILPVFYACRYSDLKSLVVAENVYLTFAVCFCIMIFCQMAMQYRNKYIMGKDNGKA